MSNKLKAKSRKISVTLNVIELRYLLIELLRRIGTNFGLHEIVNLVRRARIFGFSAFPKHHYRQLRRVFEVWFFVSY